MDEDSIGYFKDISEEVGIPYKSHINLYLRDCAAQHRKLDLRWIAYQKSMIDQLQSYIAG